MKRSGPLPRRTPLRTRTPLVGSSPSARSSRLTRKAITSKRKPPSPEEKAGKKGARTRAQGRCECCGRPRAALDVHHRLNRSQGGTWALSGLLAICRACHDWIGANPLAAAELGWTIRNRRNPLFVAVRLAGHGWSYLTDDGAIHPASEPKLEAS